MRYQWLYGIDTFELSDSMPFDVVTIDGIDTAPVQAITEQGPLQHGDTDTDMRLQPRVVQMKLQAVNRAAPYDNESNRELFNRLFAPSKQLGKLRITYDNGKVYEIVARCLGNSGIRRGLVEDQLLIAGVALRCPDPLWYNPVMNSVPFGIAAGSTGFTVPTPVPTFVGTSTLDQVVPLTYAGTFQEFPIFQIYGPITSPKMVNQATGRKIDFSGITINNGDYYTVDLRYGRKFVYKNGDTNDLRTAEVTTDSQLATFALEANPDAIHGINPILVTGTSVNSATQIYMQYFDRYAGI